MTSCIKEVAGFVGVFSFFVLLITSSILSKQEGMLLGLGFTMKQVHSVMVAEGTGAPQASPAMRATFATMETQLSELDQWYWKPMTSDEKETMATRLRALGANSVRVIAHEDPSCVALAKDIRAALKTR